jgi:RNA-directed DNA polymerase
MLSNLVMAHLDSQIEDLAVAERAVYTRYADDLVLSFTAGPVQRLEGILGRIRLILGRGGFTINRKKTRVLGPGARKVVTGLLANSSSPRLPRDVKAHLEVAIYHLEKRGIANCSAWVGAKHPLSYLDHLAGLVQFASSVEPDYAHDLWLRLRSIAGKEPDLMALLTDFGPDGKTTLTRRSHISPP